MAVTREISVRREKGRPRRKWMRENKVFAFTAQSLDRSVKG